MNFQSLLVQGRTDGRRRGSLATPSLDRSPKRMLQDVDVRGGGQSGPTPSEDGAPPLTLDKPEGARGGEGRLSWHSEG